MAVRFTAEEIAELLSLVATQIARVEAENTGYGNEGMMAQTEIELLKSIEDKLKDAAPAPNAGNNSGSNSGNNGQNGGKRKSKKSRKARKSRKANRKSRSNRR